jgi:KDO2-lipid IV(A) lauroyltransferase
MTALDEQIHALRITWLGRFFFRCLPYRRSLVLANINQVFADRLNCKQKEHLAKAFYSHLMTAIKEMLQLRFLNDLKLQARVDVRGHEKLLAIAEEKRGILILTGHFGSWEFAPIAGMAQFKLFQGRFHFIRRTLKNKRLEQILFRRYYRAGLKVIPKKNSLQQVCDALEKNDAVVFVLDQHASLANRDGIAAEFFGKKAGTYRSLASLSRHTGVPVVPAASYRLPNGRHVLEFYDPIPWQDYASTQEAIYQNTLAYNQALERMVLAHPEQWLWLHKRWKIE